MSVKSAACLTNDRLFEGLVKSRCGLTRKRIEKLDIERFDGFEHNQTLTIMKFIK